MLGRGEGGGLETLNRRLAIRHKIQLNSFASRQIAQGFSLLEFADFGPICAVFGDNSVTVSPDPWPLAQMSVTRSI